MSLSSATYFSKNTDSAIYNAFPELNQGKRYLQKQTEVKKTIDKTRNFIESFSISGQGVCEMFGKKYKPTIVRLHFKMIVFYTKSII